MKESKPWYRSKTLWGLALSLAALCIAAMGDMGLFHLEPDIRNHLIALNLCGVGIAGFGRLSANSRITK